MKVARSGLWAPGFDPKSRRLKNVELCVSVSLLIKFKRQLINIRFKQVRISYFFVCLFVVFFKGLRSRTHSLYLSVIADGRFAASNYIIIM